MPLCNGRCVPCHGGLTYVNKISGCEWRSVRMIKTSTFSVIHKESSRACRMNQGPQGTMAAGGEWLNRTHSRLSFPSMRGWRHARPGWETSQLHGTSSRPLSLTASPLHYTSIETPFLLFETSIIGPIASSFCSRNLLASAPTH